MRRICCSCGKIMGFKPGPHGDTHGYCARCEAEIRRRYAIESAPRLRPIEELEAVVEARR